MVWTGTQIKEGSTVQHTTIRRVVSVEDASVPGSLLPPRSLSQPHLVAFCVAAPVHSHPVTWLRAGPFTRPHIQHLEA